MNYDLPFVLQDYDNPLEELEEFERRLNGPRIYQQRHNYFEKLDENAFSTRFRLTKGSAHEVLGLINRKLEFTHDKNYSLSPINQLLLALRYYATGSFQLSVGDFAGVSRPTANRVIHRVSAAIASMSRHYFKLPENPEDIRRKQLEFYEIAGLPKVIGALDCTHIRIRSPGGAYAETFRNRKGYMSFNVQAICDANLILNDLVVRWPGSAHDERIFSASRENALFEAGLYRDAVLVADSGYMNRRYLMMPLDRTGTEAEILYNESQIRTRNPIERLFGIWKRRFPVLSLGLQVHRRNCIPIIVATGVLHNICQIQKEVVPPDDPDVNMPAPWDAVIDDGMIRQQRAANEDRPRPDLNPQRRSLINNYFGNL